jgi:hypothetical protein
MTAPSCSECEGTRWVRYFSETMDGNVEVAYRLCFCNHETTYAQGTHVTSRSARRPSALRPILRIEDRGGSRSVAGRLFVFENRSIEVCAD